ncbi:MAG: DNA-processing protein DprA [Paenibacillaceae bacterium]|jgi:DNA processing protein|nr:DNA-processing protein DprA [Paenibacillaceae bacterium]
MGDRDVLIGLSHCVGWSVIDALVRTGAPLRALLDARAEAVMAQAGIRATAVEAIRAHVHEEALAAHRQLYAAQGVHVCTVYDAHYPSLLMHIKRRPWVLYGRGRWDVLAQPTVAIVGTRAPSAYGRHVASSFAGALARAGVCIVSGLARGVDTEAHRGALDARGATIAVLACGLDVVYPPEHRDVQHRIGVEGLVLTSFPWGVRPSKHAFLMRNDIIAGLSLGTLVIEAAHGSGSLHTADCALAHNREVMGIPGMITSPKSMGILERIREGATLVLRPEDVLEACRISMSSSQMHASPLHSDEERMVLACVQAEPMGIDDVYDRTGLPRTSIHAAVLSLLRMQCIRAEAGGTYVACI